MSRIEQAATRRSRGPFATATGLLLLVLAGEALPRPEIQYFKPPLVKVDARRTESGDVKVNVYFLEFTWIDQRDVKHEERLEIGTETIRTIHTGSSSRYAGRQSTSSTWEVAPYFAELLEADRKPSGLRNRCKAWIEQDPRFLWTVAPVTVRNATERAVRFIPVRWLDQFESVASSGVEAIEVPAGKNRALETTAGETVLASHFVCAFETQGGRTGPFEFSYDPQGDPHLAVTVEESLLAPVACVRGSATPAEPFTYEWTLPAGSIGTVRVLNETGEGKLSFCLADHRGTVRGRSWTLDEGAQYAVVHAAEATNLTVVVTLADGTGPTPARLELLRTPCDEIVRDRVTEYVREKFAEVVLALWQGVEGEDITREVAEEMLLETASSLILTAIVELQTSAETVDWRHLDLAAVTWTARGADGLEVPARVARSALLAIITDVQAKVCKRDWYTPELDFTAPVPD